MKKLKLKIDTTNLRVCDSPLTPTVRVQYIEDLKLLYPNVVHQLKNNIVNGEVKVLFTDIDGTVTNKAGGEEGSAFRLVAPELSFQDEKEVTIEPEHPLFGGKFEVLQDFFQNLIEKHVNIIPVTHNYIGVTKHIMEQLTDTCSDGFYSSSLPPQGYNSTISNKINFMIACLFFIEDNLNSIPKLIYIDDNKEQIEMAKDNQDMDRNFTIIRAKEWLGDNTDIQIEIESMFS